MKRQTSYKQMPTFNFDFSQIVSNIIFELIIILKQTLLPTGGLSSPSSSSKCQGFVADIVFVVDSSGSIRDSNVGGVDNWELVTKFINGIVARFVVGQNAVRIGVVEYSEFAEHVFYLDTHNTKADIENAVENMPYFGSSTNTAVGIGLTHTEQFIASRGDRPNVRNIAIVITDGVSNENPENTIPAAEAARDAGIDIFSIGITNAVDETEVAGISSAPHQLNQNYWLIEDFRKLAEKVDEITTTICQCTFSFLLVFISLLCFRNICLQLKWIFSVTQQL